MSIETYVSLAVQGLKNPGEALQVAKREVRLRLSGRYCRTNDRRVLAEDWDVLVVLDACRYDMFEELNPFEAPCGRYRSQAAATIPWFEANFVDAPDPELADVVYVTANPNASAQRIDPDRVHHLEEVFTYGYSDELRATPADVVTDAAIRAHASYPDKRLVVHYMQPHLPFIGSDEYDPEAFAPLEDMIAHITAGGEGRRLDDDIIEATKRRDEFSRGINFEPFLAVRDGVLSLERLKRAYWQNLEYVLPEVERLVRYVSGDVVITADHGNGLGEAGVYGHPFWGTIDETVMVPWVALAGEGQSPTEELLEEPASEADTVDASVEEQLKYLGYH